MLLVLPGVIQMTETCSDEGLETLIAKQEAKDLKTQPSPGATSQCPIQVLLRPD